MIADTTAFMTDVRLTPDRVGLLPTEDSTRLDILQNIDFTEVTEEEDEEEEEREEVDCDTTPNLNLLRNGLGSTGRSSKVGWFISLVSNPLEINIHHVIW